MTKKNFKDTKNPYNHFQIISIPRTSRLWNNNDVQKF